MQNVLRSCRGPLAHAPRTWACRAGAGFSSEAAAAEQPKIAAGLNMMKGEVDPPLLPDAEYPSWLWKLTEPQPMLSQLRRLDTQDQTLEQRQRRLKLQNRDVIRERNFSKAKKQ